MDSKMIETHSFDGKGYKRMVEYKEWVAATLNDSEKTSPDGVSYMQKHNLTDEVFVLLRGKCKLYEAGSGETLGEIHCIQLEPLKFYNVKAGVWHTHILAPDTNVVVVEYSNTGLANSPCIDLTDEQRQLMKKMFEED